jgi:hypothetical protein
MAKATDLISAQSSSLNRRSVLGGASLAVAAFAAPSVAMPPAASGGVRISSELRTILDLVAEARQINEIGGDPNGERLVAIDGEIRRLGSVIASRPITGMSELVERAALAVWACQPCDGDLAPDHNDSGFLSGALFGVLALAGIDPLSCNASLSS